MTPLLCLWLLLMFGAQQAVCGLLLRKDAQPHPTCAAPHPKRYGAVQQYWRYAAQCNAQCEPLVPDRTLCKWIGCLGAPNRSGAPSPSERNICKWAGCTSAPTSTAAPPSLLDLDVGAAVLAVGEIGLVAALLSMSTGLVSPLLIPPNWVWLSAPAAALYCMLLAHGISGWLGSKPMASPPETSTWVIVGQFTCSMLVLQSLMVMWLCSQGPKAQVMHILNLPAGIMVLAWIYLFRKLVLTPQTIESDILGLTLYPEHFILWLGSTSMQCLLWAQLHHIEVTQRSLSGDRTGRTGTSVLRGFPVPATALLLAQILMWTGLLGSLDYGPCGAATLVPNYVLISIYCGTFYFLLRLATRPLRLCEDAFAARGARRISIQSRMVRMYVYMTWHAFPTVWAAAAYGRLDSNGRESLFVLCDLCAKILPVSVFLTMVSVNALE